MSPSWTQLLWNLSTKCWEILAYNWGPEWPPVCLLPWCAILLSSNDQLHPIIVSHTCCSGFDNLARLELRFPGLPSLSWIRVGWKKNWGKIWEVEVKPQPLCSEIWYKTRCYCHLCTLALTLWHIFLAWDSSGAHSDSTHKISNVSGSWVGCVCSSVAKDGSSFSRLETVRGSYRVHRVLCLHGF